MPSVDSQALGRVEGLELSVIAYRNQSPGFDPRSSEGARRMGGRFNPSRSFPVLYLCTTRQCAVAELTRQADRQSVPLHGLLPRELWEVRTDLTRILDLTNHDLLGDLGIDSSELVRPDHRFTQTLGEAAFEQSFQAILAPSATGVDQVLAVFPERLAGAVLTTTLVDEWSTEADIHP
jgi:RES domain-containing protein